MKNPKLCSEVMRCPKCGSDAVSSWVIRNDPVKRIFCINCSHIYKDQIFVEPKKKPRDRSDKILAEMVHKSSQDQGPHPRHKNCGNEMCWYDHF